MVTWQRVKEETQRDSTMQELMSILDNGFPQRKEQLPPSRSILGVPQKPLSHKQYHSLQ